MIKVTKDGRTIRTAGDYTKFRKELYRYQNGECMECGRFTKLDVPIEYDNSFHTDHIRGRGGGKRSDTLEACRGLCGKCHRAKHNQ